VSRYTESLFINHLSLVLELTHLANGNPLCSQKDLTSKNQYDATIDVNVCSDSGAKDAVFGHSNTGLAIGTAEEVDCRAWNGTKLATESGASSAIATASGVIGSGTAKPKSGAERVGSAGCGMLLVLAGLIV
jgi:hypothetical protein